MAERATRQMLDGIAAFRDAYKNDPKFKTAITQANELEQAAEKLVPGAYDRTSDAADAPTDLKGAEKAARNHFRAARKSSEETGESMPDSEAKEGSKTP